MLDCRIPIRSKLRSLTDSLQPCSYPLSHGHVWLILFYLHSSGNLHYLVRDPNLLRWQHTLGDASLHLW